MKLRCIAVDDEPLALDKLSDYIEKIDYLELMASLESGLEALTFLRDHEVDLVFLDIQMPQLSGLDLAKVLPLGVQVVFITAHHEYAIEGYTLNVTDYILKPLLFDRLKLAAEKALEKHQLQSSPAPQEDAPAFLFVKTEFKLQKVALNSITHIEGMKDYLMLHTTSEKIMTLQSFKEMQAKLPPQDFVRVHKSYIVAISHIDYIERHRIYIADAIITITETYKEQFYEHLKDRGLI